MKTPPQIPLVLAQIVGQCRRVGDQMFIRTDPYRRVVGVAVSSQAPPDGGERGLPDPGSRCVELRHRVGSQICYGVNPRLAAL